MAQTTKRSKSVARSSSAKGKGFQLPPGSLVCSVRKLQAVCARPASGEPVIIADASGIWGPDLGAGQFEPYGLAFDSMKNVLWISDKLSNRILLARLCFNEPDELFLELEGEFRNTEMWGPCMLDFSAKHGLVVACSGDCSFGGSGVFKFDGKKKWEKLAPTEGRAEISHTCWLPDGRFCYVTRFDSVVHIGEPGKELLPLTSPARKVLSPESGQTRELRLRYVQGLVYCPERKSLLIADCSLGCVYEIDPDAGTFRLFAGRPTLSNSLSRACLGLGPSDVWLGPVRAIALDSSGQLNWVDGESGSLFAIAEKARIQDMGPVFPTEIPPQSLGTGLIITR